MRKYGAMVIAVIILAGLFSGCAGTPPVLDVAVTSGGVTEHRPALLGLDSWSGADAGTGKPDPLQQAQGGNVPAFGIDDDQCSVEIRFMKSCRSFDIEATPLSGGDTETVADGVKGSKPYSFTANMGYIYTVHAEFRQGGAYYYFSVNKY